MLHKMIEIEGWRAGWLERELPAFQNYANGLTISLQLCILTLALITAFKMRGYRKELAANPSSRAGIFARLDQTVMKMCRGHWFISFAFLFNTMVISCVDAYIGLSALGKDVSEDPAAYDKAAVIEIVLYCVYIMALFLTTFFVVPLIQMLLLTSVLARFMRKRGMTTLSGYVQEARLYSTHIAQFWTIAGFLMMAWWVPTRGASLTRWIALQAALGSSSAWLDASFAFNFFSDRVANRTMELGSGRLSDVLRMFADTMVAAHTSEKGMLPRYTDAVAPEQAIDEKTPLAN